jgi:hypothetical protein
MPGTISLHEACFVKRTNKRNRNTEPRAERRKIDLRALVFTPNTHQWEGSSKECSPSADNLVRQSLTVCDHFA